MDRTQWVTFNLEDETYGVDVMLVQEVLRNTEIAPVPGSDNYILGIINLRGSVVTVIDARTRFNLMPREQDDTTRIIIVEVEDNVIGILVDSVAEVVEIDNDNIENNPTVKDDEASRYIQGVCQLEGKEKVLLILVDLKRLLAAEIGLEVDQATAFF